ncbi:MAG: YdeI/OmpD-associated family protein [Verrucomicrobiales bacterium]|nr:YdeI/OmpD-associated family protein [Verrucomicrobiales bacterium]
MPTTASIQIIAFDSSSGWEAWLEENHASLDGVWLRIFKKNSGQPTVSYAEALDGALCYGWIDGQRNSHDAQSYLQKFTPRRPQSVWSKINTGHIERLVKMGRMKPSGLAAVAASQRDGRWQAAYDSPSKAVIPKDFLEELSENKKAKAFFATLNKANLYSIAWRLQTAKKPETRERRMEAIPEMLAKGKRFHG